MKLLYITLFTIFSFCATAQVKNVDNTDKNQSIQNTFNDVFKGEPGKAALYSLLIPGGGQAYNRKYWKIPLAIGLDAATFYYAYSNRANCKKAQTLYLQALETEGVSSTNTRRYKLLRNKYRKNYDYARVYFVIGHLLSVFDAYIDNHMQTFDISDDLSLGVTKNGVGLTYNF